MKLKQSDVIITYDGSLAGFYAVVYDCVYGGFTPLDILPEDTAEPSLVEQKHVETDMVKATKVRESIPKKISQDAFILVEETYLTCMAKKEMPLLKFLILGYEIGGKIMTMLGHETVSPLIKASKHMYNEAMLLRGFIRFSDHGGKLIAEITPKNFVIPIIADHFCDRFYNEEFMIYDKTHKAAFIWENRQKRLIQVDDFEMLDTDDNELNYQNLWKCFYNSVALLERNNPKCRISHCPKRYWENMVELKENV